MRQTRRSKRTPRILTTVRCRTAPGSSLQGEVSAEARELDRVDDGLPATAVRYLKGQGVRTSARPAATSTLTVRPGWLRAKKKVSVSGAHGKFTRAARSPSISVVRRRLVSEGADMRARAALTVEEVERRRVAFLDGKHGGQRHERLLSARELLDEQALVDLGVERDLCVRGVRSRLQTRERLAHLDRHASVILH